MRKHYDNTSRQTLKYLTIGVLIIFFITTALAYPNYSSMKNMLGLNIIPLMFCMFLWITAGQTHIVLAEKEFITRTSFSKNKRSYSDLKTVCIVHEYNKYFRYNKKYRVFCENKRIIIRAEPVYIMCFLTRDFEKNTYKTHRSSALYNNLSVREYLGKHCVIRVTYTLELLEELLNHIKIPVYMKEETLNDINSDIQRLFCDKKINTTRTIGDIVMLDYK